MQVKSTVELWQGRFGDEYTQRCRVEWRERVPFWQSAMAFTEAQSVFEFGCNCGWNLLAIQSIAPATRLCGADVNARAVEECRQQGIEAQHVGQHGIVGLYEPGSMDLAFSAGCLIHVAPQDLERTMRSIIDISGKYVLAVEYAADHEIEIEYRGHHGALWKRPFGKLYQDLGLTLLSEGVAGGFDECNFWLLEKA